MKKLTVSLVFLAISVTGFCQQAITPAPPIKTDYLKKSKKQKTAAWLMLGGGLLMTVGGYTLFVYEGILGDGIHSTNGTIGISMFYAGGLNMLGSIPLFIAAARNKGRFMSATMGLKIEKLPSVSKAIFPQNSYPAINIKFKIK